jgi:hypothetical protein
MRLSSVLRSVCYVGLLPFHKPYLGALVTGWLGYPRFKTLLLFCRSGVSRFLIFWFDALSISDPFTLWWSAVFRWNIHPSLGLWPSQFRCLLLEVELRTAVESFKRNLRLSFTPPLVVVSGPLGMYACDSSECYGTPIYNQTSIFSIEGSLVRVRPRRELRNQSRRRPGPTTSSSQCASQATSRGKPIAP